jgi:hypothetical protein
MSKREQSSSGRPLDTYGVTHTVRPAVRRLPSGRGEPVGRYDSFDLIPGQALGSADDHRDLCQIMGSGPDNSARDEVVVLRGGKRIR